MTTWKASRLRWSTKALVSLSHKKTPLPLERRFLLIYRSVMLPTTGHTRLTESPRLPSGFVVAAPASKVSCAACPEC